MKPTRPSLIIAIAVVGIALGWGFAVIVAGQTGRSVPVPVLAGAALWLLAIAMGAWTWFLRPRLRRDPGAKPVEPIAAARTAAFAMAASRTAAVVGGLYAGIAIASLGALGSPAGAQAVLAGLLAATGAVALAGISLWLESMCRLPEDQDPPGSGGAGSVGA
ncbi:MAG: hypothetical protein RJB01_308 [Actinomycetota bacterium]